MSKYSISMSLGTSAIQHTQRDEKYVFEQQSKGLLKNVDKTKTYQNVILKDCQSLEEEFNKTFESATLSYNDKQKAEHRLNRVIDNYYQYVKNQKQGKKAMKTDYEYVLQFGNSEDGFPDNSKEMLIKTFNELKVLQDKGFIHINYAAIHMDEATPHMHINITPIAKDYKKGMPQRPAINKMISQMLKVDRYKAYEDLLSYVKDGVMEKILNDEGYERLVKGNNFAHQDVENYKKSINLQKNVDNLLVKEEELLKNTKDKTDELTGTLQQIDNANNDLTEIELQKEQSLQEKEYLRLDCERLRERENQLRTEIKNINEQVRQYDNIEANRTRFTDIRDTISKNIATLKIGWEHAKEKVRATTTSIREVWNKDRDLIFRYTPNYQNGALNMALSSNINITSTNDFPKFFNTQKYTLWQEAKRKSNNARGYIKSLFKLDIKQQQAPSKSHSLSKDYAHPTHDSISSNQGIGSTSINNPIRKGPR